MQIALPLKINYKRWDNMKLGKFELNHIYHMDCLEGMKLIPNKSIDMILCDLPYGVTSRNKWDSIIPLELLWNEYKRIIKDNGAIVLTAIEPFTSRLIQSQLSLFKYKWTWDKRGPTGFLNAKKQPLRVTEDILIFYKKQCTYNPIMITREKPRIKGGYIKNGGSTNYNEFYEVKSYNNTYYPTNLISISNANRKDRFHPTQKPVKLFEYLIQTYTKEGEIVLDNCIGSGTTALAALRCKRKFIGFEIEPKYIEIANERIKNLINESDK